MLISSSLASPKFDIFKSDIRPAIVDRRRVVVGSGGERSDNAFAAAGEKVRVADFSEGLVIVDVD